MAGGGDACAFGGDEVVGLAGGLEGDVVEEDIGELLEGAGEIAEAGFPGGLVDGKGWRGWEEIGFGNAVAGFDGEVAGGVFFFGSDLLLGFDFEEAVEGFGVAAIGGEPEAAGEGGAVVGEGEGDGGECGVAVVAVGVVLVGAAEADLDVGDATAAFAGGGDGSVLGADVDAFCVGDGVADEVGPGLLGGVGAEGAHGAVEFRVHGVDEYVVSGGRGCCWGDGG